MPEELVTLRAMAGQDEVNHGTKRYWVDRDTGLVRVPRSVSEHLLKRGGFALAKQEVALPHGFVKVRHYKDPTARCSGTPMEDGAFMIPGGDVVQFASHGFYPTDENGNLIGAPQDVATEDGKTVQAPPADPALIQQLQDLKAQNAELTALLKAAGQKAR
jgi:hypothetical protein